MFSKARYILPAVLIAGLLAWFLTRRAEDETTLRKCLVEEKLIGRTITERGFLASARSVPVHVQATGEILELVKNGTAVETGDVVLRTDITDLDERIEDRELSIHTARTEKEVAEAEYKLEQIKATNDLAVLESRLEFARLRYATEKAGLTDEERRLLEIDEQVAALDLQDAEDEFARQKRLFEKGFVAESSLEPFERRVESARERIRELKTRSELKAKGIPPEELLELKSEAERLAALLKRNAAARARRLEQVKTRIATRDARIAKQLHELKGMKRERAMSVTTAATNGVVSLRMMRDWGGGGRWTEYKPGVRVHRNDRIADIINPGNMAAQIMIHEADAENAGPGQTCRVRLPAFPGRRFPGQILEIGGVGRDRFDVGPSGFDDGHTGITVFNAAVSVESNAPLPLRPGMSAVVSILVEAPAPRLVVPRAAVLSEDNRSLVLRESRFGPAKREVQGRIYDEHNFLVEGGLEAGDVVLVPDGADDT